MTKNLFWENNANQALLQYHAGYRPKLLGTNPKVVKGEKKSWSTKILHLSPHTTASKKTLCPFASEGCKAACLNTSGMGAEYLVRSSDKVHPVHLARAIRTIWLRSDRQSFLQQLHKEIKAHVDQAKRKGMMPCVRLNGTSDIIWETLGVIKSFPEVTFYDYTAIPFSKRKDLPDNYHLTFSCKEDNENEALNALKAGHNVAVVFRTRKVDEFPATWNGYPVVNGDENDLRFLDPKNCVIGLTCKGNKAMTDNTGFVKEIN